MTTPAPRSHPHSHPRQALARSIGLSAFVYGYPLIESMRTCRMQTSGATLRAPIDTLFHIRQASTDNTGAAATTSPSASCSVSSTSRSSSDKASSTHS